MNRWVAGLLLCPAALVSLAGCGLGAGGSSSDDPATLIVTRDFGNQVVLQHTEKTVPDAETAMRQLQRSAKVSTRYGGGYVQCINGLCGKSASSRVDWFYFLNGVEAPKGAAATGVRPGDAVWWDRRDWSAAQRAPAVVGSFPEPFLHGPATPKRLPVRIECADVKLDACKTVTKVLVGYGIPAATGSIGSSFTTDTLRVLVGPWTAVRQDATAALLEDGPQSSGVFAEPSADGRRLSLLDPNGHTARTIAAGAGLVAATRAGEDPPVWVVTGTDAAGLEGAARAFTKTTLAHHFAMAVDAGASVAVPVQGGGT